MAIAKLLSSDSDLSPGDAEHVIDFWVDLYNTSALTQGSNLL